jgi:tRNA A37 methylthiotransferase MiaB
VKETEDDFEQTLDVFTRLQSDGAFTFIYSPGRGTEAALMTYRRVRLTAVHPER